MVSVTVSLSSPGVISSATIRIGGGDPAHHEVVLDHDVRVVTDVPLTDRGVHVPAHGQCGQDNGRRAASWSASAWVGVGDAAVALFGSVSGHLWV